MFFWEHQRIRMEGKAFEVSSSEAEYRAMDDPDPEPTMEMYTLFAALAPVLWVCCVICAFQKIHDYKSTMCQYAGVIIFGVRLHSPVLLSSLSLTTS